MAIFRSDEDVIAHTITTYQKSYGMNSDPVQLARSITLALQDNRSKVAHGTLTDDAGRAPIEGSLGGL